MKASRPNNRNRRQWYGHPHKLTYAEALRTAETVIGWHEGEFMPGAAEAAALACIEAEGKDESGVEAMTDALEKYRCEHVQG